MVLFVLFVFQFAPSSGCCKTDNKFRDVSKDYNDDVLS